MGEFFYVITAIVQIVVFLLTLYITVLGMFGMFRKKEKKNYTPTKKFALLIAAHNEEVVVGSLIKSMLRLDYPRDMFDIFVIADNCTDKTAEIARGYEGVYVYERFDESKKSKPYALEWMFQRLFELDKEYDAVGIFDADNLVDKDFLKEINSKMLEGFEVVQGFIETKNPNDTWVSTANALSFWSQNRMFQLSRSNVGLSNQLGGTGFVFTIDILKELGWGATCLTEDLEFTCKLVLNGKKVGWAHDAKLYDEKPLTLKASWRQRRRWMQGFTEVMIKYWGKLLKKGIKERKWIYIDCALYVLQPFTILLIAVSVVITALKPFLNVYIFDVGFLFNPLVWQLFASAQVIMAPLILFLEKKINKPFFVMLLIYSMNGVIIPAALSVLGNNSQVAYLLATGGFNVVFLAITLIFFGKKKLLFFFRYLLYALYTLTWIPITIQGILNRHEKEWTHTKHVRSLEICDM